MIKCAQTKWSEETWNSVMQDHLCFSSDIYEGGAVKCVKGREFLWWHEHCRGLKDLMRRSIHLNWALAFRLGFLWYRDNIVSKCHNSSPIFLFCSFDSEIYLKNRWSRRNGKVQFCDWVGSQLFVSWSVCEVKIWNWIIVLKMIL